MNHPSSPEPIAEAEWKVCLTPGEFAAMPAVLAGLGFAPAGESALCDHYLDFTPSPDGGWDYARLRISDGDRHVLAEKRWAKDAHGNPVRLEQERPITREEADHLLRDAAAPRTLRKRRWEFTGTLDDRPATVVLDALEMAGTTQYFLECEMLVAPAQCAAARILIVAWMRTHLPVADFTEAPSMLDLLLGSA